MPMMSGTRPVLRSAFTASGPTVDLIANVQNTNTQFSTDETLLSGFLPRVTQCSDGSWCCSYDATCCSNGRGVFLDSDGNSATAEATATTSYPPVSSTGLARFVSTFEMSSGPYFMSLWPFPSLASQLYDVNPRVIASLRIP